MKYKVIGIVLIMTATWGGAYAFHSLPEWAGIPTIITALFMAAFGFAFGDKGAS